MHQPKGPLPPPRGVPKSVSDLYGTDEIDFLLDEIKDLEPACCQLEDIQVDFAEAPLKPPRNRVPKQQRNRHDAQSQSLLAPLVDVDSATASAATSNTATPEKFYYTPSPRHADPYHHHHNQYADEHTDDNFILIVPSPKLSAKHNRNKKDAARKAGFLRRVFRRKTIGEGVEQQRMTQFQTDKELHEIQVLDSKGRRKKTNKHLVVLAGRVDTTEEDEDIVPISIGENDQEDGVEELPRDPQAPSTTTGQNEDSGGSGGGGDKGKKEDFDIAGSRAGGGGGVSLDLESPLGTVTSWDSHAFYKQRLNLAHMTWGVQLHCDIAHLRSLTGIFRILLVISSILCLAFECSAGTVQVGLFLLPLIGRLRLMVFCALFSLLVTCLMLFLDISHIAFMFPFNWSRVNALLYVCVGLLFLIGSSLLVHLVLFAEAFAWVPRHTKDTLIVCAVFGYSCAVEAFVLSGIALCCSAKYLQVPEDQNELCERDREMRPMGHKTGASGLGSRRGKTGRRVSKRDLVNNNHHIKGGPLAGQPMDEGDEDGAVEDEEEDEDEGGDDTDENQVMLNSASGDDMPNHQRNHNATAAARGSMSSFTHKPYIPAKRPDQATYNYMQPTLGHHNSQVKTNSRYRQGYHYQPIASTSTAQSPTFVLDEEQHVKAIAGPSTSRSLSEAA